MLTKRIIACLDVDAGRVVKGVQFTNLRDAGYPATLAHAHAANGADEIVLLDISAAHQRRATLVDTVARTAKELFIPFTVGGGIRTLEDAALVFAAGADKISINSAALADPTLITQIAARFGSQAVVVAIDAKRCAASDLANESLQEEHDRRIQKEGDSIPREENDAKRVREGYDFSRAVNASQKRALAPEANDTPHWQAFTHGGRTSTGRDAIAWAQQAESLGAGEILLTSMNRDGTASGFDCDLTRAVAVAVRIPVIASGGAGNAAHFAEVFRQGHADAALAASIFHYGINSIAELKQQLSAENIPVRWPC